MEWVKMSVYGAGGVPGSLGYSGMPEVVQVKEDDLEGMKERMGKYFEAEVLKVDIEVRVNGEFFRALGCFVASELLDDTLSIVIERMFPVPVAVQRWYNSEE